MLEIERVFLIKKIPDDLGKCRHVKIRQGYIGTPGSVIRVRSIGNKFELTKKTQIDPNDARVQREDTIYLTKEEFDRFWSLVDRFLEKSRYYLPLPDGHTAELDKFEGKLEGYFLVEVEFKNEEEMNAFVVPDWFGREISQEDISFSNFIAGKSYEEIKDLLE